MYMKAKVALETAYNWMFPLESEAYVERLDANMSRRPARKCTRRVVSLPPE